MDQWLSESLSRILDFEVPDDLIKYILSIDNEADLKEYIKTLIDFDNAQHKNFFSELCKRKFPGKACTLMKQMKKTISKKRQQQQILDAEKPVEPVEPVEEAKSKRKTKYVNLYSQEGNNAQVVLLKGRHHCNCQASKHELINNCINCGRVVCKQEGSGPCLFCGNLVCTPEEQREINAKTKGGAKLMESLMERSRPKGWEAAMSHRNRLLEYDRTSERRTRVTDDDSDYFQANSVWLSASEKEKLEKYQQSLHDKKHESRLSKKVAFDFAGRQVVEDNSIDHEPNEDMIRQMSDSASNGQQHNMLVGVPTDRDVAPGVNAPLLKFDPSVETQRFVEPAISRPGLKMPRVQDSELQTMSDTGMCLSMHQPWASLLVEGIKLHEGRSWYTSHRGRLWIASGSKPPEPEIVAAIEQRYKKSYPDLDIKFPSFYPTGCLLGFVNVDDCLPLEEYEKRFPGEIGESPYMFICSNPVSLRLRFPIKGQHKIYALDKSIHQAAVKSIQSLSKIHAVDARAA